MSTLLWICLHYFGYVYTSLIMPILLCLHYFGFVFITSVMTTFSLFICTLPWICLHYIESTFPLCRVSTCHPVCRGSPVIVCWSCLWFSLVLHSSCQTSLYRFHFTFMCSLVQMNVSVCVITGS